jgi:predicted ribosomally synthesized peptide with nif11-like leader
LEERIALIVSRLRESPELKEKLLSAQSVDEAIDLANEYGLELDLDSILKLRSSTVNELSDEELEGIAGGGQTKALGWPD